MDKFLTIAKIVKPQGIRGELKVLTYTDSPKDLQAFGRVYIAGNEYKMLKVRPQDEGSAFITLSGIADRNAAELLRGQDVLALKSDAPALPEGTYYIADIIGCTAFTGEGEELGKVKDITPARCDVYTVLLTGGGTLTFPAVEGVIESVDTEGGRIVLNKKRLEEVGLFEK